MAQSTIVLEQFLRPVQKQLFDSLATKYNANKRARVMTAWAHFTTLTFAQVAGLTSLRELEQATTALSPLQQASGLVKAPHSTMAEADLRIPCLFYQDLFYSLLPLLRDQLSPRCCRVTERMLSLDSTVIPLCLEKYPWATYRYQKGAIKLHALLDHTDMTPAAVVVTDGLIHDIRVGRSIQFQPGETVAFDLGYFDTTWFDKLNRDGVNFVTRKKTNIATTWIHSRAVDRKAGILGDWIIEFTGKLKNKYPQPLRQIKYRDPMTHKVLIFLTNMLDEDAAVIAEIYRQRWQIELFFKWIKQHLKIKAFLGTSENAVMTQIWVAMIVYLLLHLQRKRTAGQITAHRLLIFIAVRALQNIPLNQAWQDFQRTKRRPLMAMRDQTSKSNI